MCKQLKQTLETWDVKLARTRPGQQARLLETLPREITMLKGLTLKHYRNEKRGRK